jgi:hypothetical protein
MLGRLYLLSTNLTMEDEGCPKRECSLGGDFPCNDNLFGWVDGAMWKWIEPSFGFTLEECFPQLPILDKKEIRMKFKENIIIGCNTMNICKVIGCFGNMENRIES